jgi:hypothetical protein
MMSSLLFRLFRAYVDDFVIAFDKELRGELYRGQSSFAIPRSYYYIPITSIGGCAFENCSGLTSIEIPNSVTSIGGWAFEGCSGLTSIEIPNSVTSICHYAFYGCSGLTSIEIPNSVTSIGKSAFYDCSGLTSIDIPNSVTSIGDEAFRDCNVLLHMNWHAFVPLRSFLSYHYEELCSKLIDTFPFIYEFCDWKDLARMSRVSKWFHSDILVRSRLCFLLMVTNHNNHNNNSNNDHITIDPDSHDSSQTIMTIRGTERICATTDDCELIDELNHTTTTTKSKMLFPYIKII